MTKLINGYDDFKKIKIGGCGCNKKGGGINNNYINMDTFINSKLLKLRGGYENFKLKRGGFQKTESDFNFFRDVMNVPSNGYSANINITSDLSSKSFNYPNTQLLSRSIF